MLEVYLTQEQGCPIAIPCCRIVVAHRLSTVKNCGRILVLDGGRIVESGTYDELIAQNGFFADLVKRQKL